MAILTQEEAQVGGFRKEIEESALDMMQDILQRYQYQFPHKSAIRELTSNAIDAIREKEIALGILSGTLREEDYFIRREGEMYKDSNFDPKYYNKDWLWSGGNSYNNPHRPELYGYYPNKVYITYEEGGDTGKDRLLIEDFGVGMGGRRVERYFNLGFSTKRNTIHALGKYGIGAKAGLAAAPFYTMTTRYNGREYSFNIYPHQIQSIVPRFNTETGKENGLHLFSNGEKIYYRETKLPNGTVIALESKKHHKQMYIDAVKSQLLYFDNVVLRVRNKFGGIDVIPHQAGILYEDEHIILSDNNQYSKPHLLISKINYGNVNFQELELEDKHGNIGIKVAAEDVTTNPSRESLMWDDKTREAVVTAFGKVVGIAERIVAQQLKVDDFLEWIKSCAAVKGKWGNDSSVVGRLAQIVDLSNVEIPYSKDPSVVYGPKLFMGLNVRLNTLSEEREGSVVRYRITRHSVVTQTFSGDMPIVVQKGRTSFKKDKYLLTEVYPEGFISFQVPFLGEDEDTDALSLLGGRDTKSAITPQMKAALEHYKTLKEPDLRAHMEKISNLMQSAAGTVSYEDIEVPEDFDDSEEVVEEEIKTEEGEESRKARQKLMREKGVIPIFTPRNATSSYVYSGEKYGTRLWDWQKLELPVEDIDKWDEEEVYYATEAKIGKDEDGKDIIEAELLHVAAAITRPLQRLVWAKNDRKPGEHGYDPEQAPHDFDIMKLMPDYTKKPVRPSDDADWKQSHPGYAGIMPMVAGRQVPPLVYGTRQGEWERMHNFFGTRVKLIKVAQDRRKFFLDFKPIQRFFLDIKGKTLTMSNALVRWNTARVMNEQLHKLKFLENFSLFDNKAWTAYHNIKRYVADNYRELKDHSKDNRYYGLRDSSYTDLVTHCDKLMKFQLLVRDSKDNPTLIAAAAKELFAPQQEITDGLAIDTTFYDTYVELLDYAAPIYVLLNEVTILTKDGAIGMEVESEIRSYLASKGVQSFGGVPMIKKDVLNTEQPDPIVSAADSVTFLEDDGPRTYGPDLT